MLRLFSKLIVVPHGSGIRICFEHLVGDIERTAKIFSEIELAFSRGRKILVLNELAEHVGTLRGELKGRVRNIHLMGVSQKKLISRLHGLHSLPTDLRACSLQLGN